MAKIEIEGLSHRYPGPGGRDSLGPLDLVQEEGEFVAVVGPSGSGKSTLLRLVAGLMRPTAGRIRVDGAEVTAPSPERGMVFQQPGLFPWLSVADNVGFGLRHRVRDAATRQTAVAELLAAVGLAEAAGDYPAALSGGMAQRAALARALAPEPSLLLLDEPFAALDQQTRAEMQEWLAGLLARRRVTTLLVTHDIEEAVYLADRVLVLSSRPGRVLTEIAIDLPRPRAWELRTEGAFTALESRIGGLLRADRRPRAGEPVGK